MARPVKYNRVGYLSSRSTIQSYETLTGEFWKCNNCNQIMKTRSAAIIHSSRTCKTSIPTGVVENKTSMCKECGIVFYDSKSWVNHEALHLENCRL